MTLHQVNLLNIVLMFVSLGAALIVPFELFLFAYAFLGPLHYLTEMSWLHDRKYFLPERRLAIPIVGLTALVALTADTLVKLTEGSILSAVAEWGPEIRFAALAISLVYLLARTERARWIGLLGTVCIVVVAHLLNQDWKSSGSSPLGYTAYDIFFLLFLTTIIHVYVFTGAFVVLGALRSRSRSGMMSLAVFLVCTVACFIVPVTAASPVSEYVRSAYDASSTLLNLYMTRLAAPGVVETGEQVFASPVGTIMARVIAYAYTYHYLNWFSKTSVIRWHEVSRARMTVVVLIWLASLAVYSWDYLLGLHLLFFLSMLHVFLEFPLNWRSFLDIGSELKSRLSPAST